MPSETSPAGRRWVERTRARAQRLLLAPSGPLAALLGRLATLQAADRAVAIGALAFSALFPLLIVYSAVAPVGSAHDFAQHIVERLKLTGAAAQSAREVFAPSAAVGHSITVIGFFLVIVSSLSLARSLQRACAARRGTCCGSR